MVLVGLNPIVLIWGLGGDHNDFLMVFFIMLGFYLLLRAGGGDSGRGAAASGATRRGRPRAGDPAPAPPRARRASAARCGWRGALLGCCDRSGTGAAIW